MAALMLDAVGTCRRQERRASGCWQPALQHAGAAPSKARLRTGVVSAAGGAGSSGAARSTSVSSDVMPASPRLPSSSTLSM
jgi:hypothetical protein